MSTLQPIIGIIGALILFLELNFSAWDNNALAALNPSQKPYLVILDPGHGGKDTGAEGHAKSSKTKIVYEKDITLGIAIRLRQVLQDPKYWRALGRPIKIVLTREKDVEVSLAARTELAQKLYPDLFLSIHANSEKTGTVRGFETFFLDNTSDESDQKLSEIEQKSHGTIDEKSLLLRTVAADANVSMSKQAAEIIHRSFGDHLKEEELSQKNRGVRHSMLYVLLDTKVPAVLFESLYMSHPKDLAFLTVGENRQKIAEGLAGGILRFLASK